MGDSAETRAQAVSERLVELVRGRAEAVARVSYGESSLTRFANSRIHQNVTEDTTAVSLTVAKDGKVASAETTRPDVDSLEALVERALAAAELRPADPEFAGFAPAGEAAVADHWDDATAGASPDERAEIVEAFVAAGHGLEAAGYCATAAAVHALASTTGQRLVCRTTRAQLDGVQRAPGGEQPTDGLGQRTSVHLADLDGAACGARAAAKARAGVDPIELPPGSYEVVLEPRAVAQVMLFPTLGFNGREHAEGTSFAHLGEQQWDAAVDIWDDATDPRGLGVTFDVEGTPKRRVHMVRAGVTVGLAHDRRSARLAGADPTGHAVGNARFFEAGGGFATDVFLGGGDSSPDDLVAGVERGLLVTDLWYNRILDPKTQVVTGLTRNGLFLIEGGAVGPAVQNLRYTQSIVGGFGPGKVLGLGNDAQLVGSETGWTFHVPTVRLAAWSFTGNARG